MPPTVLSLGSVDADFQFRVSEPIEEGSTLLADDISRLSGGKAANRAFLAQYLGVSARLLAQVGDDDLAEQALRPLQAAGLDLSCVERTPGSYTAVSFTCVPPEGKKTIVLAPNANDDWRDEAIDRVGRAVSQASEGSLLAIDAEVSNLVLERAVEATRRRGFPIVLDPSPADRVGHELLSRITAIAPSAKEAGELTGVRVDTPEDAAQALRKLAGFGIPVPVVKLSDGGCVFLDGNDIAFAKGLDLPVEDTTGAGDAFAGALAVALLERRPIREAAAFAMICSSLSVRAWGLRTPMPNVAASNSTYLR